MPAQATEHPAVRLLRTLGDPVRFRLLRQLPAEESAELSVGALARRLGVSDTVVSQHLRVLASLRLVSVQRRGRTARYFVNAAALRAARELLAEGLPTLFGPGSRESRLSARNQLFGRVVEVRRGDVNAEVGIDIGGQVVTAVITNGSVDRLELRSGDVAAAVFKASEVMVLK
jgi:molybdopterin-binding protein